MAYRTSWAPHSCKRATLLLAWTCSIVLLNDNVFAEDVCNEATPDAPVFCPASCRCSDWGSRVDCENKDEIPQNLTKSLRQLYLSENNLTHIRVGDFEKYPCLVWLSLTLNHVSDIETDAIKTLEHLQYLSLAKNRLTELSWKFPSSLKLLNIAQNRLRELTDYSFKGLYNLISLELQRNEIQLLAPCAFCDLVKLDTMILDFNQIENLSAGVFSTLTELRDLRLSENNLKIIDSQFFDELPRLEKLEFRGNQIENLTGALSKLTKLKTLDLSQNNLKVIESRFFDGLTNLKRLALNFNKIENLTGAFSNLTMLETFEISQNNLKLIESQFFFRFSNLKTLRISEVPTSVKLDESIFDSLQNLTSLEAANSPLLVQSIIKSARLLHGLGNIQELRLDNNQIFNLREDFPSFFPRLKRIYLTGNAWHCDREIVWFLNWLKESVNTIVDKYELRCASPASIEFKPLLRLNEKDFQAAQRSLQTGYYNSSGLRPESETANDGPSTDDLQTQPSQIRVAMCTRHTLPKEAEKPQCLDRGTTAIISTVLAIGCFVLVLMNLTLWRLRHNCFLVRYGNTQRNTSHSPQNENLTVVSFSETMLGNEDKIS